jgi:hypothetical protein
MTSVSEALHNILTERNQLREEVKRLHAALAMADIKCKQWESWCLGAQQALRELKEKHRAIP